MKTDKFEANIGIAAGYHQGTVPRYPPVMYVLKLWQTLAEEKYKETGIYISMVARSAETLFRPEWGCPEGGEKTITMFGERNPEFVHDAAKWKEVVIELLTELAKALGQSTCQVTFTQPEFVYIKIETEPTR